MVDVASLVLRVDALEVKEAERALNGLEKQAGDTEQSAAAMGRTFGAVVGAGMVAAAGAIVIFTKNAIDAADAMNDLHIKTGVSISDLAAYDELARQSGTSVNAIAQGFKFLSKYMVEHSDKLKSLGVTSTDTNEAMRQFADVIASIEDPALRSALAQEVLGRSGTELLPALIGGKAGLDAVRESTTEYGKALTTAAPLADAFNDKLEIIKTRAKTAGLALANELLPFLDQTASEFIRIQNEAGTLLAILSSIGKVALQSVGFETDPQKRAVSELNDLMREHRDLLIEINRRKSSGAEIATLQQQEIALRARVREQIDLVNAPITAAGAPKSGAATTNEQAVRDTLKTAKKGKDDQFKLENEAWVREKEFQIAKANELRKTAEKSAKEIADANEKEAKRAQQSWERFTDNVQRNLGDVLYNGLNGSFQNIGDAFKQMLMRMMADAAAAQLTQAMFGSASGGGAFGSFGAKIGGFFGAPAASSSGGGASFASFDPFAGTGYASFAGGGFTGSGSRSGGVDGMGGFPAILHPNETVVDHTKGQSSGASVTVVQNINIDSRSDASVIIAAMTRAKDMAKAEIMSSLQRGGDFAAAVGRA